MSTLYRDMLVLASDCSADALLAMDDAFAFLEADDDPEFPGDVGRFNAGERRRAIRTVLTRRELLAARHPDLKSTDDATYAAWRDLARMVRDMVEMPRIFDQAHYELLRRGRNHRRNVDEWAGACPLCGGTDRLRVWAGPNGRAWCRQCGLSWDVITATRTLVPGCEHFRDAVRWLAELANLPVPEPLNSALALIPKLPGVRGGNHGNQPAASAFEYRRGRVVAT